MSNIRSYKGHQECIYQVDGKPKNNQMIKKLLQALDANIVIFESPDHCLKELAINHCDLLITNITLPRMNGLDLLQKAKDIKPWLPVLMISGSNNISTAVQAMKMGASDYLKKPLKQKSLLNSVKTLLDQSRRNNMLLGQTLTKTERAILPLIINGQSNKSISEKLHRSVRTIEHHRQHILQKLDVSNVMELMIRLYEIGVHYEHRYNINKKQTRNKKL